MAVTTKIFNVYTFDPAIQLLGTYQELQRDVQKMLTQDICHRSRFNSED